MPATVTPGQITTAATKAGVPPSLFRALVQQESGGRINALSPAGAIGPTQLMPATAASLGVNPRDPMQNLLGGARYLGEQLHTFGSPALALAAYNAGPGAVEKYHGIPPYAETQNYVRSILANENNTAQPPVAPATPPRPPRAAAPAAAASPDEVATALLNGQTLSAAHAAAPGGILDTLTSTLLAGKPIGSILARARTGRSASQQAFATSGLTTPTVASQSAVATPGSAFAGAAAGSFKPLNGTVPMTTGGTSPYSNLTFAGHTDWRHVDPTLLATVNRVLAARGLTGDVISGYRDNTYSAANGGFAGDPHSKGIAIDVYVNGKPVTSVVPGSVWQQAGVRPGSSFTYKGAPDMEHLDLIGHGY